MILQVRAQILFLSAAALCTCPYLSASPNPKRPDEIDFLPLTMVKDQQNGECGSARLEHWVVDPGVGGSNPLTHPIK
jgi:hypothetical protein